MAGRGVPKDVFFMTDNQAHNTVTLLSRGLVGRNNFGDMFNEVLGKCEVKGVGFKDKPTLHSLRSTLISKLQRMGHTESQII